MRVERDGQTETQPAAIERHVLPVCWYLWLIVCYTDTWLHDGVCSGLLDPNSELNVLRKDRMDGRGGGVCVFARKHLRIMPVTFDNEFRDIEMLCFDLINTDKRIRFFVLYRPPSSFRQSSSPCCAATQSQHVRWSGIRCCWPGCLELTKWRSAWSSA